ncbi:hypothetical protein Tco_0113366, partial [Tanacetum coccineum]
CIALGLGYEVGESSSDAAARSAGGLRADYGFVAIIDREIRRDPEREIGYRITELWDEIVETLQGVLVSTDIELGQHMTAFETKMETEARLSREAWRRSMDASDLAREEVMSLRTTVLGQMLEIRELHDADRRRQAVTLEMLKADHRRGDSTTRTGDHLAGVGDSPTGIGGSITGTGHSTTGTCYCTTGIVRTRWRSCTARVARGG